MSVFDSLDHVMRIFDVSGPGGALMHIDVLSIIIGIVLCTVFLRLYFFLSPGKKSGKLAEVAPKLNNEELERQKEKIMEKNNELFTSWFAKVETTIACILDCDILGNSFLNMEENGKESAATEIYEIAACKVFAFEFIIKNYFLWYSYSLHSKYPKVGCHLFETLLISYFYSQLKLMNPVLFEYLIDEQRFEYTQMMHTYSTKYNFGNLPSKIQKDEEKCINDFVKTLTKRCDENLTMLKPVLESIKIMNRDMHSSFLKFYEVKEISKERVIQQTNKYIQTLETEGFKRELFNIDNEKTFTTFPYVWTVST